MLLLYSMYSFYLPFWIQLKRSWCAHRLLSESTRILCTVEEQAPREANAGRLHQIAKYCRASRIFYGLRIFSTKAMRSRVTRCKWDTTRPVYVACPAIFT